MVLCSAEESESDDSMMCESSPISSFLQKPKKRKTTKNTKKSSTSSSLSGYQSLVQFQDTDGHFSALPSSYSSFTSEIPESLKELVKDESQLENIWVTILSLFILERDFTPEKGEWVMIAKKAKAYLKREMKKGADFKQFMGVIA